MHAKLIDSLKRAAERLQSMPAPGAERQIIAEVLADIASATVQNSAAKPNKPAPVPLANRSVFGDIFENKVETPKAIAPPPVSVTDPWQALSKTALLLSGVLAAWEVDAKIRESEASAQSLATNVQRLLSDRRVQMEGDFARLAGETQHIQKLRQDIERVQSDSDKSQQEAQLLRSRLQGLQQEREELIRTNTQLLSESESVERELGAKQEQLRRLETTRQQLIEADSRLQRYEAEVADLNERHRLARERADQLRETVEATRALVTLVESRSNDAHAQRILSIWRELPDDAFDLP